MKIIINKYLSAIVISLLILGCKDSFLEHKPLASVNEETFYTTMIAADQAVTACYSTFCLEKVWDLTIMMTLGTIASDEAEAGAGGKNDVIEFQHVDQLTHTSSEANVFQWPYGYLYRSINHCNIALQKLPTITRATDPTFNAATIEKRLGEVRFIRASNYFTLTQIFGGVPLVDHVLTQSEYNKGRDDIYKIYNFIKNDLQLAISALPEQSGWDAANHGRASKGAATALLAKVYLYESSYAKYKSDDARFTGMTQHWDSVSYYAKQVINSGEYELIGINGERFSTWRGTNTGGYQWIFMKDGNNSKEGVFEIQNNQDGLAWFYTRGSALTRWTAARQINPLGVTGDGSGFGWGWLCPTAFLINSYEAGDPRMKATVLTDADSINCYQDNANGNLVWGHPSYNILFAGTGLNTGCRKYECSYDEYWLHSQTWQDGPIHVKLIRFADVILWAAEAAFESGYNTEALQYINMVRTRARMSGSGTVPADLTAITHDDIVHERLVELACEGHRFFDLVRWNLATQYLNTTLADGSPLIFESPKFDFFPIPAREVALTAGILKQYPGWE